MSSHSNTLAADVKSLQSQPESEIEELKKDDIYTLSYHQRAFWLLFFYIPLVALPWIMTVFLSRRPFGHESYANHQGFSGPDLATMENWVTAINVLNSIANLITIPVISALLAQAAVVYTQRVSPGQQLSVRHLFSLADRGWNDYAILLGSWSWEEPGSGATRMFLYVATSLTFLSKILERSSLRMTRG